MDKTITVCLHVKKAGGDKPPAEGRTAIGFSAARKERRWSGVVHPVWKISGRRSLALILPSVIFSIWSALHGDGFRAPHAIWLITFTVVPNSSASAFLSIPLKIVMPIYYQMVNILSNHGGYNE